MTLHDTATQLYTISTTHRFNGEHFSRQELEAYIRNMFRGSLKAGNRLVMTIRLADGEWPFTVNHYNEAEDAFDYTIPENREQAEAIWSLL